MWQPLHNYSSIGNDYLVSKELDFSKNRLLIRCRVPEKINWRVAGYVYISDGYQVHNFRSFQSEKIFLGVDQYVGVSSDYTDIFQTFYVHFYPKYWVADWGYNYGLWYWE